MLIVQNRSRKKAFRRTKRIVSAVLPPVSNRLNIGTVPRRVAVQLIKALRAASTRGVSIKLFFEAPEGYRGLKCIEFGARTPALADFTRTWSSFDLDLAAAGVFIPTPLIEEPKK